MADIYNTPNLGSNRRFQTYLNQYGATSGRIPSSVMLDQIVQSELDASSRRMAESRRLAETQRQFDVSQQNAVDTAEANRKAGLVGTALQAGSTYALYNALKPAETINLTKSVGDIATNTGNNLAPSMTPTVDAAGNIIRWNNPSPGTIPATPTPGTLPATTAPTVSGPAAEVLPAPTNVISPVNPASSSITEYTLNLATGRWELTPPPVLTPSPITVAGEGMGASVVPAAASGTVTQAGATNIGTQVPVEGVESALPGAIDSGATTVAAPWYATAAPATAGVIGGYVGGKAGEAIGESIGVGGRAERNFVGSALGGAAAGAMTGAAIGAAGGPIGAGAGAIIGGTVGGVSSLIRSLL